jgi:hypothetical protein
VPAPTHKGVPLTRWSLDRLSAWLAGQGIEVSPSHLGRLLAEAGLSFQRTRSWKASPDPDYETRAARVLELYRAAPIDGPVISFDQMGPISLKPIQGAGWARRKRPERLRATYNRKHTILDVYRWVRQRERDTPNAILTSAEADDALLRLGAVYEYTERQRDGILGTAAIQLKAYGHPAAARTAARGQGMTPAGLFDPAAGHAALYIVAGREHQQLLAPLVVTMLSSLLFWLSERENRTGKRPDPNCNPTRGCRRRRCSRSMRRRTSRRSRRCRRSSRPSLSAGVRFLTVWHSVAQLRRH